MATIDEFMEEELERIDEKIRQIDQHKTVRAAQKLLAKKAQLQGARRALLGAGPRLTGGNGGGSKLTQDEVSMFLTDKPPMSSQEIADAMGYGEPSVRAHLNRGKGEWCIKTESGKWVKRDPEQDAEEDDDD